MIDSNADKECERNKKLIEKLQKTCGIYLEQIANMRDPRDKPKDNDEEL